MTQNDKPVTEIEDLELQWAHLNHVGNDTDRGIIKKYQVGDKEKDRLTITMVPRYDCYCKNNLVTKLQYMMKSIFEHITQIAEALILLAMFMLTLLIIFESEYNNANSDVEIVTTDSTINDSISNR